jgi:hypothetical protein
MSMLSKAGSNYSLAFQPINSNHELSPSVVWPLQLDPKESFKTEKKTIKTFNGISQWL